MSVAASVGEENGRGMAVVEDALVSGDNEGDMPV